MESTKTPTPCLQYNSLLLLCPQCHTVPLISIDSNLYISFNCECSPSKPLPIDEFVKTFIHKEKDEMCFNTKKHGDIKAEKYCMQCNKWICDNCLIIHNDFSS